MNKLTKVGCSALCGSLAAIASANAGELTVTGGVDMSWISKSEDVVGNPIGMGSNLTFKGSGELDNGWTFDLTVAHANKNAYSTAVASVTMGSFGSIEVNQGDSTNGIDKFDDVMPTAWEEPWGAGLGTGIVTVVGIGTAHNIEYTTPTILGTTVTVGMAEMGQTDTGDKGSGGTKTGDIGRAYDITAKINASLGTEVLSGLNFYFGGHSAEIYTAGENEQYEGVAAGTYALGPVELGYGHQGKFTGNNITTTDIDYYRNTQYAVAFNINDDLSLSYGYHKSQQGNVDNNRTTAEVWSGQVAYSIGGASIRLARAEGDNIAYADGVDRTMNILSVSLAF